MRDFRHGSYARVLRGAKDVYILYKAKAKQSEDNHIRCAV